MRRRLKFARLRLARPHALLYAACRCGLSGGHGCLACLRWRRHFLEVETRRSKRASMEGRP